MKNITFDGNQLGDFTQGNDTTIYPTQFITDIDLIRSLQDSNQGLIIKSFLYELKSPYLINKAIFIKKYQLVSEIVASIYN